MAGYKLACDASSFQVIYRICDEFPKLMESNGRWARRWFEKIYLIATRERARRYFKVRKRIQIVLRRFTLNLEIKRAKIFGFWLINKYTCGRSFLRYNSQTVIVIYKYFVLSCYCW